MKAENEFGFACRILGGHDVIEEFVAAKVWPLAHGWKPNEITHISVDWMVSKVPFPRFGLHLPEGMSLDDFISEVEKKDCVMVGKLTLNGKRILEVEKSY
jgi:hypothetical protein